MSSRSKTDLNMMWKLGRRFHRDDRGAAYTLAFVLLLPFYVFLVVAFLEISLLLSTRVAVQMAANAAARAAVVAMDADYVDLRTGDDPNAQRSTSSNLPYQYWMIHRAIVNSLAPFASGSKDHAGVAAGTLRYPASASGDWAQAYYQFGGSEKHGMEYLKRKWSFAAKASRFQVIPINLSTGEQITQEQFESQFNAGVKVIVEYRMPFHTSGAGRVFGTKERGFYARAVTASATMERESPKSRDGRLPFRQYYQRHSFTSSNSSIPVQ